MIDIDDGIALGFLRENRFLGCLAFLDGPYANNDSFGGAANEFDYRFITQAGVLERSES